MASPIYINGWEFAAPFTTNGSGLYSLVTGSWTLEQTVVRTGSFSAKAAVAPGVACNIRAGKSVGGTALVQSAYINFGPNLPGGTVVVNVMGAANSPASTFPTVGYNPNTGFFTAQFGTAGRVEDNVTVQPNTWYKIDFKGEIVGTTCYLDVKINGRALLQTTGTTSSTSFTNAFVGTARTDHAVSFDLYFDDWIVSATSADYPLGGAYETGVRLLKPYADGTHVINNLELTNQLGTVIGGGVPAYSLINSAPPDATQYLKQTLNAGTDYAEVLLEALSATHNGILGAQGILAYTSQTTTANRGACIISKDNFASYTEIWGNPTTTTDYSDGATTNLFFKTAIIAGAVSDATVNALKARLGYSGDTSPNPYWVDLGVEVAYTVAAGSNATINLSGVGNVAANVGLTVAGSITGSGSGTVAIDADNPVSVSAALTGSGTVAMSVVTVSERVATISLSGSGSLSASAAVQVSASASLSGSGSPTVTASVPVSAVVTLQGSGALALDADNPISASLALSGSGTLSASASISSQAAISVAGSGAVDVRAGNPVAAQSALAGSGAVAISASHPVQASAALSGSGVLQAAAALPISAQVSGVGNGAVSAQAGVVASAAINLTGDGTVAASISISSPGSRNASISLTGDGTLASSAAVRVSSSLNLQGSGSLAASGALPINSTVTIGGQGVLQASIANPVSVAMAVGGSGQVAATISSGNTPITVEINLSGDGQVSAQAAVSIAGAVGLSGVGNTSASVDVAVAAAMELSGDGSVRIFVGINPPDTIHVVVRELGFRTQTTIHELGVQMTPRELTTQVDVQELNATILPHDLHSTITEV